MKQFKFWSLMALIVCAFGSFTLVACGDDDDDDNVVNSPIVGTWQDVVEYDEDGWWSKTVQEYTFEKTGKFTIHRAMYNDAERKNVAHEDFTETGTYTVNGSAIKLHVTGMKMTFEGQEHQQGEEYFEPYDIEATFSISGNQLTFHYTSDGRTWEEGPYTKK